MAKVTQNNALIALVLIIIGVVVVAFMLTKETKPVDNIEGEEPYAGTPAQNLNFLMPEAWSYTDNALKDVQSLAPGQVLQFGIVPSMNDQGVYHFITAAPDPKIDGNILHSVYRYNSDYTFERVYRVSYSNTTAAPGLGEDVVTQLHAIGHDGYNLIILAQDVASSPGPCTEPLTLGRLPGDKVYEILSLNLLDPLAKGLEPYRVPDDIYQQALDRSNECIEDIF